MGKSPMKEMADLQEQIAKRDAALRQMEAAAGKLQRRLAAKAREVEEAKQARREALTLLREAATDPTVRDRAIALLAADQIADQKAEEVDFLASQKSSSENETAQPGA